MKTYIGIDNGVTGSIGLITEAYYSYYQTPTKKEQDYTKAVKNLTRIDVIRLREILSLLPNPFAVIERPMVNPKRWAASMSAIRALEATISFLEANEIGFAFIDSKEWQRELLPKGCKAEALKTASHDIGIRMFPKVKETIEKQKDADGLLIAEYARRKF